MSFSSRFLRTDVPSSQHRDGDVLAAAEGSGEQNRAFLALVGGCAKWGGSAGAHALTSLPDARGYLGWSEKPGGTPAQNLRTAGAVDHRASDAPARQYFDTLSSRYWFVCRTGAVPLRAETAPDLFGSACAGKRARQQFPPEKPSFEFRGRTAVVCREERASTPGRRSRSVLRELARAQSWRNLRCLRHATGESIPSVYRLLLLLHVRGQGRRNERRRRFFALSAVQP